MVTLRRKAQISETFKLGKEKITISLDPMKVVREFKKKYETLAAAEKAAIAAVGKNDAEEIFETYGNAIFAVMDLFFGEENRKKIVTFYDYNYVEMTQVILPYITDKLLPKVQAILSVQRDSLAKRYGA
jgi:hypothetical protein